ncbi:hypothetical protein [Marinobacter sp. CA1]|uniref:hypothetical protein n=1 Tax=Marinobacter sp. CA1 TaxID=2817656 RepID=UPI001D082FD7|nr:hypothetical protein [Marinobacter sp. CA1]UDL06511.1 hypothetical protein J2887_07090 [Marinobacter sp. CA1]
MEVFDTVNLAISVGLGLLSIGLAVFAIWLSFQFSNRSEQALDSVKDLSGEIRTLVEVSLTHQKDFSSKMLDSLIEQNQYGSPEAVEKSGAQVFEEMINRRLDQAEQTITQNIEEKIQAVGEAGRLDNQDREAIISSIKNELTEFRTTAREASVKALLPIKLKRKLESFLDFPAHYVVLAAIIKSGANTLEALEKSKEFFHFPEEADSGIENLLEAGLLTGDLENFQCNDSYLPLLKRWVARNNPILRKLSERFELKTSPTVDQEELSLAKALRF